MLGRQLSLRYISTPHFTLYFGEKRLATVRGLSGAAMYSNAKSVPQDLGAARQAFVGQTQVFVVQTLLPNLKLLVK